MRPGRRAALRAALEVVPAPRLARARRRCAPATSSAAVVRAGRPRRRADARRRRRARRLRRVAPRRRCRRSRRTRISARPRLPALRRAGRAARGRRARASPPIRAGDAEARAAAGAGAVALGVELRRCNPLGRRERNVNEIGPNFIARPYRGVSVQDVDDARRRRRCSRTCARGACTGGPSSSWPTRGDRRALVQVEREDGDGILVARARRARPRRPRRDRVRRTTSRSTPATRPSSRGCAGDARVTVVAGPLPARELHRRARAAARPRRGGRAAASRRSCSRWRARCSTSTRTCRRSSSTTRRSTCASCRPRRPTHYLFPCRCSGWSSTARRSTSSTPARRRADWTLVGCERSRQIHEALYGAEPSARIDFCPRARTAAGDGPTLIKCCLLERGIERDGERLVVPWGATLEEVRSRDPDMLV